ncbi:MAG: L-lactate dehydrogenase [bacterium]|nr:L-lactate dehydrogenase [bacterium]
MNGNDSNSTARRKVVVVGAGFVGSVYAYALAQSGLADEIALMDKNEDLARGQVMDLAHGQAFFPTVSIRVGGPEDYADAGLIVITAGAPQKPGERRLELLSRNSEIVGGIVDEAVGRKTGGVILVVTNPVDGLTHAAVKRAGLPKGRVIGSGTVLDSARLRYLLSRHCKVDIHNVHAYVLGEHGDSEFAAWSMTHIAGMSMDEYCPACGRCRDWKAERCKIEQAVRDSAYHVIGYKGATYFAVGQALTRISAAVLRGQNSVLTVSTELEGEYGISGASLSVPAMVSREGVVRVVEGRLAPEEQASLEASAEILRKAAGG